jgi:dienelactone hydrolase
MRLIEVRAGVEEAGRSFVLLQERVAPGVLLLPAEGQDCGPVRRLAERLFDRGFTVLASSLAYRTLDLPGISPIYWQTCLDEAENRYDMLQHYTSRVGIVGVGLGAAMALHVATTKHVHNVVALFPTFDARVGIGEKVRGLLRRVLTRRKKTPAGWPAQRSMAAENGRQAVAKHAIPLLVIAEDRRDRSDAGRSVRVARRLAAQIGAPIHLLPAGEVESPDGLPRESVEKLVNFLRGR